MAEGEQPVIGPSGGLPGHELGDAAELEVGARVVAGLERRKADEEGDDRLLVFRRVCIDGVDPATGGGEKRRHAQNREKTRPSIVRENHDG